MQTKRFGSHVVVAFLFLALAAIVGCQPERLTVEEYAKACGDLTNNMRDRYDLIVFRTAAVAAGISVAEAMEEFEDTIADFKELKPPEDLERLHELYVEAPELARQGLIVSKLLEFAEKLEELENLDPDEESDRIEEGLKQLIDQELEEEIGKEIEDIIAKMDHLRDQIAAEEDGLSPAHYDNLVEEGCESFS